MYRQEQKCTFGAFSQYGALQCLSIYFDGIWGIVFIRLHIVLVQENVTASMSVTARYMCYHCMILV